MEKANHVDTDSIARSAAPPMSSNAHFSPHSSVVEASWKDSTCWTKNDNCSSSSSSSSSSSLNNNNPTPQHKRRRSRRCWVENVRFMMDHFEGRSKSENTNHADNKEQKDEEDDNDDDDDDDDDNENDKNNQSGPNGLELSVVSWNVLAESYLTPRSHSHLPAEYGQVVFNRTKRRELLLQTLTKLANNTCRDRSGHEDGYSETPGGGEEEEEMELKRKSNPSKTDTAKIGTQKTDILCLQEADLLDLICAHMDRMDYDCVHTPVVETKLGKNKTQTLGPNVTHGLNSPNISSGGGDTAVGTAASAATATAASGGGGGRVDSCVIFWDKYQWELVQSDVVQFDDLATLNEEEEVTCNQVQASSSSSSLEEQKGEEVQQEQEEETEKEENEETNSINSKKLVANTNHTTTTTTMTTETTTKKTTSATGSNNNRKHPSATTTTTTYFGLKKRGVPLADRTTPSALTGIVQSYLRRNAAVIAVLRHREQTQVRIVVTSAHLYWHPGYEYVKLSQAKYLMDRIECLARRHSSLSFLSFEDGSTQKRNVPVIVCGDTNSKPGSVVHRFLTNGIVDARKVAPWHYHYHEAEEDEEEGESSAGYNGDDVVEDANEVDGQAAFNMGRDSSEDVVVVAVERDRKSDADQNDNHESVSNNDLVELNAMAEGLIIEDKPKLESCDDTSVEIDGKTTSGSLRSRWTLPVDSTKFRVKASLVTEKTTTLKETKAVNTVRYGNDTEIRRSPESSSSSSVFDTSVKLPTKPVPTVRYLLDNTLNRFTRWLRILGIDAAIETDAEERDRTRNGRMFLFDRCRAEKRTLLTSSYKLLIRKDCPPGTYLINPKSPSEMEFALVRLLLTHGVALQPRLFLSRCVVCNGEILDVFDPELKRKIFERNQAPDLSSDLEVYECNGCGQGYWWCDRPTSSASRVKNQATRLFEVCLRGGIPVEGPLNMFDFVDVDEQRKMGIESGEFRGGVGEMKVISWLKSDKLSHPYGLRSAYALFDGDGMNIVGERLPFTNVTHDFVGTLDYILYESEAFSQNGSLYVPTTFKELNAEEIRCGHLLPSDVWPSDHLAIGVRLQVRNTHEPSDSDDGKDELVESINKKQDAKIEGSSTQVEEIVHASELEEGVKADCTSPARSKDCKRNGSSLTDSSHMETTTGQAAVGGNSGGVVSTALSSPHGVRCACGCVPQIFSLFEMAELRKQAKLKAQRKLDSQDNS